MQPIKALFKQTKYDYSGKPKEFKGLIVQITNEENSSDAGSDDKVWFINSETKKLEFVNASDYDIYALE